MTTRKAFAVPALLAAAAMVATPAAAIERPAARSSPVEATSNYGPGGGWGWGGGYRRHRGGSTAGGILAGVVVLGAIAAIAGASNRAQQRRYQGPYRYPAPPPPYPYPDRRYDARPDYRGDGQQGLSGAANICLREVERNNRAREVTRVERSAGGWVVDGVMADGAPFTCSVAPDGRVDSIDFGSRARDLGAMRDRQYNDDVYRSARANAPTSVPPAAVDAAPTASAQTGPQPAYPGGPLPGDEVVDDAPRS